MAEPQGSPNSSVVLDTTLKLVEKMEMDDLELKRLKKELASERAKHKENLKCEYDVKQQLFEKRETLRELQDTTDVIKAKDTAFRRRARAVYESYNDEYKTIEAIETKTNKLDAATDEKIRCDSELYERSEKQLNELIEVYDNLIKNREEKQRIKEDHQRKAEVEHLKLKSQLLALEDNGECDDDAEADIDRLKADNFNIKGLILSTEEEIGKLLKEKAGIELSKKEIQETYKARFDETEAQSKMAQEKINILTSKLECEISKSSELNVKYNKLKDENVKLSAENRHCKVLRKLELQLEQIKLDIEGQQSKSLPIKDEIQCNADKFRTLEQKILDDEADNTNIFSETQDMTEQLKKLKAEEISIDGNLEEISDKVKKLNEERFALDRDFKEKQDQYEKLVNDLSNVRAKNSREISELENVNSVKLQDQQLKKAADFINIYKAQVEETISNANKEIRELEIQNLKTRREQHVSRNTKASGFAVPLPPKTREKRWDDSDSSVDEPRMTMDDILKLKNAKRPRKK